MSRKHRLTIPVQTGTDTIYPAGTQVFPAGAEQATQFMNFLFQHRRDAIPPHPFTFKLVWLGGGLEALDPEVVTETDL